MDQFFDDPIQTRQLHEIARRAVWGALSSSAYGNLAEDVASQAVFELWRKIEDGDEVHNPEGLVTTIAKRRALDAQRKWETRRHGAVTEFLDEEAAVIPPELISEVARDLPSTMSIREWLRRLVEKAAGDEIDAMLAERVWLEAVLIEAAADAAGLAPKTARNRLTTIRRGVEKLIEDGNAPSLRW